MRKIRPPFRTPDHTRCRPGRIAALLLAVAGVGCAAAVAAPPSPGSGAAIVLVSIDGLRPEDVASATAPFLTRMQEAGARATDARTVLPSFTVPSHVSMLTGLDVDGHGITWNVDRTSSYGPVRHPVAPELMRAAGCRTAAVLAKRKLRHLDRPGSFDRIRYPSRPLAALAGDVAEEALRVIGLDRPDFLFVHLADADVAGHMFGWGSAPYRTAVRRADAALRHIWRRAEQVYGGDLVMIVTSDHGGSGRSHGTDSEENVRIPWIAWGAGVAPGSVHDGVVTYDTAATVLWLMGVAVPEEWDGRPIRGAFDAPSATTGSGGPAYRCG